MRAERGFGNPGCQRFRQVDLRTALGEEGFFPCRWDQHGVSNARHLLVVEQKPTCAGQRNRVCVRVLQEGRLSLIADTDLLGRDAAHQLEEKAQIGEILLLTAFACTVLTAHQEAKGTSTNTAEAD